MNAADISRADFPSVGLKSSLEDALHLMEDELTEELPVINPDATDEFAGLISRRAISQALARATGSVTLPSRRDTHIYWSTGYRVTRLRLPAGAEGRTLRELDTRARFGVSILAVQSQTDPAGGFELLGPDQSLRAGDIIIAAGRSTGLRALERELRGD